jgi:hypothetical protein
MYTTLTNKTTNLQLPTINQAEQISSGHVLQDHIRGLGVLQRGVQGRDQLAVHQRQDHVSLVVDVVLLFVIEEKVFVDDLRERTFNFKNCSRLGIIKRSNDR